MLLKERISGIKIFTEEWQQMRLGKFTSSGISKLMQKTPLTDGFMTYIYQKVGEELTGKPVFDDEPETDSMRWGLEYEPVAIQKFGKSMNLDFVITQQLIVIPETRFMGTPDALIIHNESTDELKYNVSTVEVKCPEKFHRYIELFKCKTPQEVKQCEGKYYWQVLDQMEICDCLNGYLVTFHPLFRAGNMSIVHFKKIELLDEFRLLKERKQLATQKFEEIRNELLNSKTY